MARIVALIAVAALAAAPGAAAAAASNPLLNAPAQQQQQTAPAPAPTQRQAPVQNTDPNGSLSRAEVLLIVLGVVALIGGIWVVIARDARRATAGRTRSADAAPRGASATRAARRSRKLSAEERRRRKRGRAAK